MSEIIEKITAEITLKGAIPFARFMEIALYCPDYGFYEKEKDNVGKGGDFFTSVNVGGLFGELLAFQFAEWAEGAGRKSGDGTPRAQVRIVEAGAHDGRLAADILGWLRGRRGEVFEGLKYYIVEPSARRREWQRETLKEFQETVCWLPDVSALKTASAASETIIFSNELLDAMPVRRFGWDAKGKKWFEWGVAVDCGKFVWSRLENSEFRIPNSELEAVLPDGFTVESSPAAEKWWRAASAVMTRGKLLAIDYGFTAEEQFSPSRLHGTLRAYHRHQVTEDVLANPGEQDLTAHVDFSAVQSVGEMAGLKTEALVSQEKFLTRIVERAWNRADVFGEWNPQRTRQLQTLTHPEHLGRPFRVLIQSR